MALVQAILMLLAIMGISLAFASLGTRILRALRWETESHPEHFLVSTATGLVTSEVLLFFAQLTRHIKVSCWMIAALLCILLILDWKPTWIRSGRLVRQVVPKSIETRFLFAFVIVVVIVGFFSSLAPLTGSDALQYHFTVQKQILDGGFHPIFSNTHSFLCGQHHLLILFGLALGSEKLALGLIFLGGVLTAASLACLASFWARDSIVAALALVFLLTPITFWQIISSGSPDIYMAFLASAAVMLLRRTIETEAWRPALLAGYLAGGIAGAKYTGCIIAAALALAVVVEFRSKVAAALFFLGALVAGIWPYLRNFAWTHNPVFPFLASALSPGLVTTYAVKALASDAGASSIPGPAQLFPFLFFAAMQKKNPGFWDFFGPTVLVLAPLMLFVIRNTRTWCVPLLVWFLSGLGLFFASGLPRFLFPLFPIALGCVAAGFEYALREKWKIVSATAAGAMGLMVAAGAAGFVLYVHRPLRAAIGLQSPREYLRERAPDFQIAETVNRRLSGREDQQETLVFFRHCFLSAHLLSEHPLRKWRSRPDF